LTGVEALPSLRDRGQSGDLQALVTYMVEQHFIVRAIPIEDLFVAIPGQAVT